MFCPRCGTENSEETNFCRGCGEDLTNISRELAKRPSDGIVGTIGQTLTQSSLFQLEWLKNHKRRAIGEFLVGVFSLLVVIWSLVFGNVNPEFIYGVFSAVAAYLIALADPRRRLSRQRLPSFARHRTAQAIIIHWGIPVVF